MWKYRLPLVILGVALIAWGIGWWWYSDSNVSQRVIADAPKKRESVLQYRSERKAVVQPNLLKEAGARRGTLSLNEFILPSPEFRPGLRWWWPGASVKKDQISREMEHWAVVDFGRVEIHPLTTGLNRASDAKINTFADSKWYENLRHTFDEAERLGLSVDMLAGSGAPLGGDFIALNDSMMTLAHSEFVVSGGMVEKRLELPQPSYSYLERGRYVNLNIEDQVRYFAQEARLVAVVAAPLLRQRPDTDTGIAPTQLIGESAIVLTDKVKDGVLRYQFPSGTWTVVALWRLPTGSSVLGWAGKGDSNVVNHFDAEKVKASYDYLFGRDTGLEAHFGKGFRGVFNDALNYQGEYLYVNNLAQQFQRQRGYELTPHYPALLVPGRNNRMTARSYDVQPLFILGEFDERLRYDVDLTLSELFGENFVKASAEWAQRRGLRSRLQLHGLQFDTIRLAGEADIPEGEQLFSGGSELFLRTISSGALLYDRPLVSAEAMGFFFKDQMTTPAKARLAVDKLFTSGYNQIMLRGAAYDYRIGDSDEPWQPWSNPELPVSVSSDFSANSPFAGQQQMLNRYIARLSYLMQLGPERVDVLIYYPNMGFRYGEKQHNELLYHGNMPDGEVRTSDFNMPGAEKLLAKKEASESWLFDTWELIRELEAWGIRWAWVNDHSLQKAEIDPLGLKIGQRTVKTVLFSNAPFMQRKTAEHVDSLLSKGALLWRWGSAPERQAGRLDHVEGDKKVKNTFKRMAAAGGVLENRDQLARWAGVIAGDFHFKLDAYTPGFKHIIRTTPEGAVVLMRNATPKVMKLRFGSNANQALWMDAMTGTVSEMEKVRAHYRVRLEPYSTAAVYLRDKPMSGINEIKSIAEPEYRELERLTKWSLEVPNLNFVRDSAALVDLSAITSPRFTGPVIYRSSFQLTPDAADIGDYRLDLGKLYGTARISINGKSCGEAVFIPYQVNITDCVSPGENSIAIELTITRRNHLVNRADSGDATVRQFKGKPRHAQGLLGPVRVMAY